MGYAAKQTLMVLGCVGCVLLCMPGCSHQSAPVPKGPPPAAWYRYFPAVVDAQWVYRLVVSEDNSGAVVLLQTRVNEVSADRIALMSGSSPVLYMVADDGLIKAKSGNYFLKYPLTPGNRWPIVLGGAAGEAVIVANDRSVATDAGRFDNCLLVEERPAGEPVVLRTWYAPGVGVVRMQTVIVLDGKEYIHEQADLHSYSRP